MERCNTWSEVEALFGSRLPRSRFLDAISGQPTSTSQFKAVFSRFHCDCMAKQDQRRHQATVSSRLAFTDVSRRVGQNCVERVEAGGGEYLLRSGLQP